MLKGSSPLLGTIPKTALYLLHSCFYPLKRLSRSFSFLHRPAQICRKLQSKSELNLSWNILTNILIFSCTVFTTPCLAEPLVIIVEGQSNARQKCDLIAGLPPTAQFYSLEQSRFLSNPCSGVANGIAWEAYKEWPEREIKIFHQAYGGTPIQQWLSGKEYRKRTLKAFRWARDVNAQILYTFVQGEADASDRDSSLAYYGRLIYLDQYYRSRSYRPD